MNKVLSALALASIVLGLSLGATLGCQESLPGDRCTTKEDCEPPLVCSSRDLPAGSKGVCVLPEALPDAAITGDASP
ncbi:MAG: hypothetical protein RBU30_21475 [Polyangia bacterium]|mgnify:CR=1 FL=1|jgi:hypothetical protein|nr:hypothetical protein [Polyangia bacterium]